jgi:hypothetical protein
VRSGNDEAMPAIAAPLMETGHHEDLLVFVVDLTDFLTCLIRHQGRASVERT